MAQPPSGGCVLKLTDEGGYFCGAFPICSTFKNMPQEKQFEPRSKALNLTFGHKLKHAKNAVGKLVNFMSDLGFTAEEIVRHLKAEQGYPKGLEPEKYDLNELRQAERSGFIHESAEAELDFEVMALELDSVCFKLSDGYDPHKRLFDVQYEADRKRKEDEAYEQFLQRKYEEGLPLAEQMKRRTARWHEATARNRIKNSKYRLYRGEYRAYSKKPIKFDWYDF